MSQSSSWIVERAILSVNSDGHPGARANDRSVTPRACGCRVRLPPDQKGGTRTSRAVARSLVVRGAFRWAAAGLLGARSSHVVARSQPLHFALSEPGVGCSRCRQSRQTQPQTPSAPACSRLRLPCPGLPLRPTFAPAWVGGAAPRQRLRRIVL